MVKATVCCTKCATKWTQEFPDNAWGNMLHVVCNKGHKSYEVLDPGTKVDSNSLHVNDLFDSPEVEEGPPELAPA